VQELVVIEFSIVKIFLAAALIPASWRGFLDPDHTGVGPGLIPEIMHAQVADPASARHIASTMTGGAAGLFLSFFSGDL